MTAGSMLGAVAVLAWSRVEQVWQLYAVFVLIGLASAMSLYEAAFSVLVAVAAPERRGNALLAVTIVAGFASSIFLPLTAVLVERFGWRTAVAILGVLLAAVAVPGHAVAVPANRSAAPADRGKSLERTNNPEVRGAVRDRGFWLLTIAFVAHAAAVSIMAVHLVRFLVAAGHATTMAASLSGLLGVLSVTGRLVTTGLARRYSVAAVAAAVFAVQAVGAAALPAVGHRFAAAAACLTAFGLGFGVATIARPAILASRYAIGGYATIAATMATPVTLAKAAAPLGAAALQPGAAVTMAAGLCLLSALALANAGSRTSRRR
jgi:predicted MFS family arabinose efflux permease